MSYLLKLSEELFLLSIDQPKLKTTQPLEITLFLPTNTSLKLIFNLFCRKNKFRSISKIKLIKLSIEMILLEKLLFKTDQENK